MSNDPVHFWISWTSWLFGVRFSRAEIGICFGPIQVSIMPAYFRRAGQRDALSAAPGEAGK